MKNVKLSISLLVATYLLGELCQLWDVDDPHLVNWIWMVKVPMNICWNVKFLTEEVNRVLEAWAFLIMVRQTGIVEYIIASRVYLFYRCLDLVFYFLIYKTTKWYNIVWVLFAVYETYLKRNQFTWQKR